MSQETQAWAKQQRTGDPVTRAVLSEICNWAKPTGIVDFRSYDDIAWAVEVSRRTVMRHVDRLENELGLIRRLPRHRDDGGRGSNGFELIGFEPSLPHLKSRAKPPVTACHPPRDTVTPPGDTGVTPPRDTGVTLLGDKIIPLSTTDVVDVPPSGFEGLDLGDEGQAEQASAEPDANLDDGKARRLGTDWVPPPVDALPPVAKALARQWPAGAYAAKAENFRNHWTDIDPKRRTTRGWAATFANWIERNHSEVMRAAKAGVSFEACAAANGVAAPQPVPVAAKALETGPSEAIHARLRGSEGAMFYERKLEGVAILVAPDGRVRVIAASPFMAQWLAGNARGSIEAAARATLGDGFAELTFEAEHEGNG